LAKTARSAFCFSGWAKRNRAVVGLQKAGVTGEIEPGLSVRYMGTNENSMASHLVTRYFCAAVLTEDAIARLDDVSVNFYHAYVYPTA
jgi:encapsulin shell SprI-like protein